MPIEFSVANAGSGGTKFAQDDITEGANTLAVPYTKLMSGADGSKEVIPGDSANGLDVDVTRVQGDVSTNLIKIGGVSQSGANVVDTTNSAFRVSLVYGGGAFGSPFPSNGTAAGYSDGTNMRSAMVFDLDTSASTQYVLGVSLRQSSSGGSVEAGTALAPIRIDPTGTTTQPISGTVTANVATVQEIVRVRNVSGQLSDSGGATIDVKTTFANPSSSGNTTLVPAVSGKKIRVLAYRIQAGGTVNVKFVDTASTPADLTQLWEFQDREGAAITAPTGAFEFETGVGLGVQINLSASVPVHASLIYVEV